MINHWMFRCKDITRLISRSLDEDLGAWERFGIWLHLRMCGLCRRYRDQLSLISDAVSTFRAERDSRPPAVPLPEDAAERIKAHLKSLEEA